MPYRLLSQSCFYCPNLIAVAPLKLEIKRFVMWLWANEITIAWGRAPYRALAMMFTCCPNLMFLPSQWLERFQIGHLADLIFIIIYWLYKANIYFSNFRQVKTFPICSFYWLWAAHSNFAPFGFDMPQKTI